MRAGAGLTRARLTEDEDGAALLAALPLGALLGSPSSTGEMKLPREEEDEEVDMDEAGLEEDSDDELARNRTGEGWPRLGLSRLRPLSEMEKGVWRNGV
jgi:hypothetical protein